MIFYNLFDYTNYLNFDDIFHNFNININFNFLIF